MTLAAPAVVNAILDLGDAYRASLREGRGVLPEQPPGYCTKHYAGHVRVKSSGKGLP